MKLTLAAYSDSQEYHVIKTDSIEQALSFFNYYKDKSNVILEIQFENNRQMQKELLDFLYTRYSNQSCQH